MQVVSNDGLVKRYQSINRPSPIKSRPRVGVKKFEFTSNGWRGATLLSRAKRCEATFSEVVNNGARTKFYMA
jgi:hypothetical protein